MATPHYRALVRSTPSPATVAHIDFGAPAFCPVCGYCLTHAAVSVYPLIFDYNPHQPNTVLVCTRCLIDDPDATRHAAYALLELEPTRYWLSRSNIAVLSPQENAHRGRTASELHDHERTGNWPDDDPARNAQPPQLLLPYAHSATQPSRNSGQHEPPEYDPQPRNEDRQS
jgi:hypothetical protein